MTIMPEIYIYYIIVYMCMRMFIQPMHSHPQNQQNFERLSFLYLLTGNPTNPPTPPTPTPHLTKPITHPTLKIKNHIK